MYAPMKSRRKKMPESEKGISFQAFASNSRLAVDGRTSIRIPNTGTINSNDIIKAIVRIDHPNPIRGCNSWNITGKIIPPSSTLSTQNSVMVSEFANLECFQKPRYLGLKTASFRNRLVKRQHSVRINSRSQVRPALPVKGSTASTGYIRLLSSSQPLPKVIPYRRETADSRNHRVGQ